MIITVTSDPNNSLIRIYKEDILSVEDVDCDVSANARINLRGVCDVEFSSRPMRCSEVYCLETKEEVEAKMAG